MSRCRFKKWILLASSLIGLLCVFLVIACNLNFNEIHKPSEDVKGSVDFTNVDLGKNIIYVGGEWEFYWNKFIITELEQPTKPDLMIKVPDEWSHYKINNKKLPATGYGSYRIDFKNSYDKPVTMFIPDYGSAYRIFIDGVLVSRSGIISKDINSIFTTLRQELYRVSLAKGTSHEIVIETATTKYSGLYMVPILGDYKHIVTVISYHNSLRFMLFGITIFSFICLISIYFIVARKKTQTIWLPAMILILILRIMLTSEFYSFWQPILFHNLSYESTNDLMYVTTFLLKYLLIYLVQEQCGIIFYKKEKIAFFFYYCVLYLIYLLVPKNMYHCHLSFLLPMLSYALDIYLFIKVYRKRDSLIKYGSAIFFGTILVITGIAIDTFYINSQIYIDMSLILLLLFTLFALIMSCVFALRSADFYDEYMKSSLKLELAQSQIAIQKDYYESLNNQMNEIREIKHDMRHYIGVMSQLCDDGNFDKLKDFLQECTKKTEFEQLPFFCEHTVINSLIGYYYLKAKEYGVIIENRCCACGQIPLGDMDLCIVLGNALDNAVYACKQMKETKKSFIYVDIKGVQGQCLIKISNSYEGEIYYKNGKYLSSKSGHGLGISNIEKVIEAYKGYTKIEHDGHVFTLMVGIPEKY